MYTACYDSMNIIAFKNQWSRNMYFEMGDDDANYYHVVQIQW